MSSRICFQNLFLDLYNRCFTDGSNVSILLGDFGVKVFVLKKNKLIDSKNINIKDSHFYSELKNFLSIYKGWYIYFLINSIAGKIYHESIPVTSKSIHSLPIEEFINSTIPRDHLTSYHILRIDKHNIETWLTIFASIPMNSLLEKMIDSALTVGMHFGGIYNLLLEGAHIFYKALNHAKIILPFHHLQIFICPTNSFGTIFLVKHGNHVIHSQSVEFQINKSIEYLKGVIENTINDILIILKDYINNNASKITAILFVSEDSKSYFEQQTLKNIQHLVIVTDKAIYNDKNPDNNKALDYVIAKLFSSKKKYIAQNNMTRGLLKLTYLNKVIFKLLLLVILVVTFSIGSNLYSLYQVKKSIQNYGKKIINIKQQYATIKENHPDILYMSKILDYGYLKHIINSEQSNIPKLLLQHIVSNPFGYHIELKNLIWQSNQRYLVETHEQNNTQILIKFSLPNTTHARLISHLKKYIGYLHDNLLDYHIDYQYDPTKMLKIADILSVNVLITLKSL